MGWKLLSFINSMKALRKKIQSCIIINLSLFSFIYFFGVGRGEGCVVSGCFLEGDRLLQNISQGRKRTWRGGKRGVDISQ